MNEQPVIATIEVYKDSRNEWWWRAVSANGEEIAKSIRGYKRLRSAIVQAAQLYPEAELGVVRDSVLVPRVLVVAE